MDRFPECHRDPPGPGLPRLTALDQTLNLSGA